MAQFAAGPGGRLKCLFAAGTTGLSLGFDAFHHRSKVNNSGNASGGGGLRFAYLPSAPHRTRNRTVHASTSSSAPVANNSDGSFDDISEADHHEFEFDELSGFRGLVLDISYRPVNVVCWRRAICLEFMDKADVLEYYDQTVNSPSGSFYIPAVLRVPHLLQVVKRRRVKRGLSRKNIFHRDSFMCQ